MNVVMEWIFKSKSVVLTGTLYSNNQCSNNRSISTPRIGNKSSSIEQPRSDNISFKVLLNSSILHFPSNNFNIAISIISYFNLMQSITVPVVTLSYITIVEIEMHVVVSTEIVGRIEERSSTHLIIWVEIYYNLYWVVQLIQN